MYSYVMYYNIEKSGFNAVSASLVYYVTISWKLFFITVEWMNDVELTKLEENLIKTEAEFVTEMKKLHGESVSLSSVLSLFVLLKFLVFSLT